MVKDSNKKGEKPKESQFKKFVKKRAPIYLGIIALFIVFIVPAITKGDLQSTIPEDLTEEEEQVLNSLMSYKGPNQEGLSVMEAISEKIEEEYPNEEIYDNKKTKTDIQITNIDSKKYQVIFNFKTYKGEINYDWDIDMSSRDIKGNDPPSKHIIDLVDFYD